MPPLTLYKLRSRPTNEALPSFDDFIDFEEKDLQVSGPVEGPGFTAFAYVRNIPPNPPRWKSFLKTGFGDQIHVQDTSSTAAVVLVSVDIQKHREFFALTFGIGGRFLLRQTLIDRAYGVRTALNVLYPAESLNDDDQARVLGMDTKRHGLDTIRSRRQASRATTPETFDLDELRDILNAATGKPVDDGKWGSRVTGGDALSLTVPLEFDELGRLCKSVHAAHAKKDYASRFPWLDHIQPVSNPDELDALEDYVVQLLRTGAPSELDLGPPEIVNWAEVDDFKYSTDRKSRHQELRLSDFLATLDDVSTVDRHRMETARVRALNINEKPVHQWSAWKCLTGSFVLNETTYVLDEGGFFVVAASFLEEVNQYVDAIPEGRDLPPFPVGADETKYNALVAAEIDGAATLHEQLVQTAQKYSRIELCDILTPAGELIHVKRELGSRDLSHLFSQGVVSAAFLQQDLQFLERVRTKLEAAEATSHLASLFPDGGIRTSDFDVAFAVVHDWGGKSVSETLPFFSKVNLYRTCLDLGSRGFGFAWTRVEDAAKAKT